MLTLSDLVNACPEEGDIDECHFLTTLGGITLMVVSGLQFCDGRHNDVVMVFAPYDELPAPCTAQTLH